MFECCVEIYVTLIKVIARDVELQRFTFQTVLLFTGHYNSTKGVKTKKWPRMEFLLQNFELYIVTTQNISSNNMYLINDLCSKLKNTNGRTQKLKILIRNIFPVDGLRRFYDTRCICA